MSCLIQGSAPQHKNFCGNSTINTVMLTKEEKLKDSLYFILGFLHRFFYSITFGMFRGEVEVNFYFDKKHPSMMMTSGTGNPQEFHIRKVFYPPELKELRGTVKIDGFRTITFIPDEE